VLKAYRGDREQKRIFLLKEECFFLTHFLIGEMTGAEGLRNDRGGRLALIMANFKHQASNNKQITNCKHQITNKTLSAELVFVWNFGHCDLVLVCNL